MSDTPQPATDFFSDAVNLLAANNQGSYTVPAAKLYPHQWLWDSCFIAIGLRHVDVTRAQTELLSLLRGQWHNGMLPNMIFSNKATYRTDRNVWRSWLNPNAPHDVATSGITQPPMLAEAVVRIGQKLSLPERRSWYKLVWPALISYHEWLYAERDPHQEGLILLIHPWESGLDNSPPWMHELHDHLLPYWVRIIDKAHLSGFVNLFRRDTKYVEPGQRFLATEALALFDAQIRLRRKNYQIDEVLKHGLFAIEDLAFNSILVRANSHLTDIATTLQRELPASLQANMHKTREAFQGFWDEYSQQYYPRDFVTHQLLKQSSVATLLPLYAGTISKKHASQLVKLLEDEQLFGPAFPLPSVPLNSPYFDSERYWQGPSWLNINWLVIDGLRRYGFTDHAAALTESSLEMVRQNGFAEYFDPLDGRPLGAQGFSWTAALTMDLLQQ